MLVQAAAMPANYSKKREETVLSVLMKHVVQQASLSVVTRQYPFHQATAQGDSKQAMLDEDQCLLASPLLGGADDFC